ncbi:hypothetical protein MFU01_05570 [Myxococcus fulvus]|uniref:Uncharacterized protein n=1 Tax=Myxococcus fulvus TaxID=33 RepID=A0A511SUD3_MYXFU|nr:hypothetical protein MFU01_05570 [Myxococcus fulvus]
MPKPSTTAAASSGEAFPFHNAARPKTGTKETITDASQGANTVRKQSRGNPSVTVNREHTKSDGKLVRRGIDADPRARLFIDFGFPWLIHYPPRSQGPGVE